MRALFVVFVDRSDPCSLDLALDPAKAIRQRTIVIVTELQLVMLSGDAGAEGKSAGTSFAESISACVEALSLFII